MRYVIEPKSVLVLDLKFGLDICLDLRSVCLAQSIFGSGAPLPDLHRVVAELHLISLFLQVLFVFSLFK